MRCPVCNLPLTRSAFGDLCHDATVGEAIARSLALREPVNHSVTQQPKRKK